jgi:hypothetical protein
MATKIEANVSDATAAQMGVFTGGAAPVRNKTVNLTMNGKIYEVRVDGEGRVAVIARPQSTESGRQVSGPKR